MIDKFFIILMIGKLVMYFARKAPYFKRGAFLTQLFECELCLGFWIYGALALVFDFYLPQSFPYVPILSEALAGAILSFTMWLLTDGWNAKFRIMYLE